MKKLLFPEGVRPYLGARRMLQWSIVLLVYSMVAIGSSVAGLMERISAT